MENIFTRAARFVKERKVTRRWKRIITVLAAVVVFCTTYALILPAMTAERQTSCGMEEHTHTEECFENGIQVCGKEEHTHTEECYTKSKGLIVGVITRNQSSDNEDAGAGAEQEPGNAPQAEGQTEAGKEEAAAPVPEAKTPEELAQELGNLPLNGTQAENVTAVAKAHERCREDSRAFVQAVLSYSGVQGMPDVSDGAGGYLGYADWIAKIREAGLYTDLSGMPEAGGLVFLDREENAEKLGREDERVDHVGIIVSVRTKGDAGTELRDIMVLTANESGLIESSFYSMEDAANVNRIAGYAKLPEDPEEAAAEVQTEEKNTEAVTEAPSEAVTEAVTEAPSEAVTEAITEAPSEAVTEAITETPSEAGTEVPPETGAETGMSPNEGMETENVTEMSADGDIKASEETTETAAEPSSEENTELTTETELNTEVSTEEDTELETNTEVSPEEDTETETNAELETSTELSSEEDTETETDTELSSEEDTELETDTELSSEETAETETGTELSSETETGTEEAESDTDDWGWTWEDFAGQDEEEESETDEWYDWEDETEEETEGGDPEADTETSEDWEASVADVELTGIWADDLTAVAQTQLGVKESTENYQIGKDGIQRGITRYGQWYGEPYGDWDAMFVSFCLNYAEVPHSSVPRAGSCTTLAEMLQVYDSYAVPEEYEASKGDLVFLDTDADEAADHVGILAEAAEDGLTVIAGDVEDEVKSVTYAKDDAAVIGYGILPQKPAQKLYHKVYNDGKVAVTAEYTAEAMIPDEAVLIAEEVPQEDEKYQEHYETVREMMNAEKEEPAETEEGIQEVLAEPETEEGIQEVLAEPETEPETEGELYLKIYNIGFYLDEQRIRPQAEVKISIEFPNDPGFTSGANRVIRMEEGKAPEDLDVTNTGEEVEFSARSF